MTDILTVYTAKVCPYAHRVELALEEAGAQYEKFQIDLQNKPEWYAPKVNPASKVPAVAYGGPRVPADQPSPQSTKIAESLVLLEFVADLYPNSSLLPKDPVQRAKVRFFIDAVSTKLNPKWMSFVIRGEAGAAEGLLQGIEEIQKLLPEGAKYAIGDDYTIADAAIVPFLARMEVALKNDIGAFEPGEGTKVYEALQTPKYAKFWKYFNDCKARPSFKNTFDEEYILTTAKKRHEARRAELKKKL